MAAHDFTTPHCHRRGSPRKATKSADLPRSIAPTSWSMPIASAALRVHATIAPIGIIPSSETISRGTSE